MREPDWPSCTEVQMWRWVAVHLARAEIECTLVGGAVVAIYSEGAYQSGDLDIVIENFPLPGQQRLDGVFKEIGFFRKGMLYHHPQCGHLAIQTLPGPVHVSKDYHVTPKEEQIMNVRVKMLSPTDIVKDRLASCLYFGAMECLDQAELVSRAQTIDWQSISAWANAESADMPAMVAQLHRRLKNSNS